MTARRPLVNLNGVLAELPSGDTVIGASGGGSSPAKLTASFDFGDESQSVTVAIPHTGATVNTRIVTAPDSEDLALQGVAFFLDSIDPGVSVTVTAIAPNGASGIYSIDFLALETA